MDRRECRAQRLRVGSRARPRRGPPRACGSRRAPRSEARSCVRERRVQPSRSGATPRPRGAPRSHARTLRAAPARPRSGHARRRRWPASSPPSRSARSQPRSSREQTTSRPSRITCTARRERIRVQRRLEHERRLGRLLDAAQPAREPERPHALEDRRSSARCLLGGQAGEPRQRRLQRRHLVEVDEARLRAERPPVNVVPERGEPTTKTSRSSRPSGLKPPRRATRTASA